MKSSRMNLSEIKPICEHMRQSMYKPIDYSNNNLDLEPFDKLKYISFENTFETVVQFISEMFGVDLNSGSDIVVEKVITNNGQVPSLIITSK